MALKSNSRTKATATKKSSAKSSSKEKTAKSEPRLKPIPEKQTKGQILKEISGITGLTIKQVKEVFSAASNLARCHLIKKGSGEFVLPEMGIKIVRKTKPATKKRPGRNPLTGESITIPAKPKREIIRVRPLKSLKEVLE